ncbi:MAG: GHKL domain-containing protein [Candidatus Ruminococcus intestinipullorum]|nr:GHKL domain-containing protein [Candidatus Ruminococcus intestinipullorum]
MHIFVCVEIYFLMKGRLIENLFYILLLLCSFGGIDEVIGMLVRHWINIYEYRGLLESFIVLFILIILDKLQGHNKDIGKYTLMFIKEKIIIIVMAMIFILLFVIAGLGYADEYTLKENLRFIVDFICLLALIGMIILMIFIIYIKKVNEDMYNLVKTERSLKDMQECYYKELLNREEETRRYRHDMQNHLLCLSQYMKNESYSEAMEYIVKLQESLTTIQKRCYITGNDLLDIFLNNYFLPLEEVKVDIWGACSNDFLIDDVDFCIIFSNLIQNAAEAVLRQQDGEKYIRVIFKQKAEYGEITIENSIGSDVEEVKIGSTIKSDDSSHGIGLKNVADTIQKNKGHFEFKTKEGEFCAKVLLKRKHFQI